MLILNFTTLEQAQSCLDTINAMSADYWKSQGYTVVDGENGKELIGKRNGVDAPDSARTISWAEIQESPDGTSYFTSLSNDPRFPDWKETYGLYGGVPYEEIEFPEAWKPTEEVLTPYSYGE